jgi:hypothetical protein
MHPAPALHLTLLPQARWTRAVRGLGGLALGGALGWLAWHGLVHGVLPDWPLALTATALALPAWPLLRTRAVPPAGTLSWQPDTGRWQLQCPPQPTRSGHLDCPLAGHHWLLLRHHGPGLPTTWLPLDRRTHAAQWHALRCAVFSPGAAAATVDRPRHDAP